MADLNYAGEFNLEVCELYSTSGLRLDLKELVASINIYEDIFKNAVTGDISFTDTNNILTNAPILGQEKLLLKITTPSGDDAATDRKVSIDYTETPLYIYKINNKVQVNDNTVAFTVSFTTPEMIRNNRIRIAQSFAGEPAEDIVQKVFRDELALNSKKEFFYETTTNNFKVVAPNMRPFDFINSVARRCLSADYNFAPTFLFYETIKGFWFRTLDSMMDRKNPRMIYREMTPNILEKGEKNVNAANIINSIQNYEVVSSTDTLTTMRNGMWGSRLMMVDLYNKTVTNKDYGYINNFDDDVHIDAYNNYGSMSMPITSFAPDQYGYTISDYPEAAQYVQFVDRNEPEGLFTPAHGDETYDYVGTDQWLQRRRGRFASLDSSLTVRIQVPGNTFLQAGDVVGLVMRNKNGGTSEQDPYLTGRYLARKVRHQFVKQGDGQPKHTLHIECVRDAVKQPYPSQGTGLDDGGNEFTEIVPTGSSDAGDVRF